MASQIASYLLYAGGVLAVALWGIVLIQRWAPAASRRGGSWELEALLLICGPINATIVAFYPSDGSGPGSLGAVSRLVTNVAYILAAIALWRGLTNGETKRGGLIVAVVIYYFSLIACGLAGVVPGIPEAYWLTPLVVLAFIMHTTFSVEWFLMVCRICIRAVVILSFISGFLYPDVAFNHADIRQFFGLDRLQGITSHPNTLGIVAAVGFILETKNSRSRLRLVWGASMLIAVVLAQSSTAYVALAVGVLLVASRFSAGLRRMAVGGAFLIVILMFVSDEFSQRVQDVFSADEAVKLLNGRTGIWEAALVGFYKNPVWGYGPSLLDEDYRQMYLPHFGSAAQAHNQWFQTLGEAGLFGATALLVLVIVLVVYAVQARRPTNGVSVALLAMFFVRSVSETPLRPAGISLVTFVLILVVGVLNYARRLEPVLPESLEVSGRQQRTATMPTR
jgi:exopolysaccharide production protein ExoQ